MWVFFGIVAAAIAIIFSASNLKAGRAIGLDRGAMFKAQSNVVICTNCQTKMKRQRNGQQCPNCNKNF
ncbi:MAG: hypothetical protein ACXVNF_16250 [Neobacillus sp.]